MTIEECFRLRLLEILDGTGIRVSGIEPQDTQDGKASVAFTFGHGEIAEQYGAGSPGLSYAEIAVLVSHETPSEVWRVARLIRLGLAERQRFWPLTGQRRRLEWVRPLEGSEQGVIDDPKRFVDRGLYACCFDDRDGGLVSA